MEFEIVGLKNWNRREQYEKFKEFEDPIIAIDANVPMYNVANLLSERNVSKTIFFIFVILKVTNELLEFKFREHDGNIFKYKEIHGSCPILKSDNMFNYGFFKYNTDFEEFLTNAKQIIEETKNRLEFDTRNGRDDLIHISIIPWISFSSIKHARRLNVIDSVPKIVLGKIYKMNDKDYLPVSISGHHGFLDGYHLCEYLLSLEKYFKEYN